MEFLAHGSYVDVTVTTAATWETKTLDSSFDGASGVIILWNINNQGRSGVRPTGAATSNPPRKREDGQRIDFVRLDTNNQFQIRASNTLNSAWVIGHFTADEATFFDADIYSKDITPTKDGTWKTIDLSAHTASAGPTAAIIMIESSDAANGNAVGFRDSGSSQTYTAPMMSGDSFMVLCPSTNDDIEMTIGSSDTVTSVYLIGYVTDGLTKETTQTYAPTTGSWQDIDVTADLPGGQTYTGVLARYWADGFTSSAFRQNGDTTDYNDGREQTQVPVKLDASDIFEAKIGSGTNNVIIDFWAFSAGASSNVTVSDVDTDETVFPGQTATAITGTNFEATQGSGAVDIDGVGQTETSWADTAIQITVVQGNNKFGAHNLTVTNASASSDSIAITLVPATGHGYVDMSSPITNDPASVAYNTSPAVVTGDQFEWHDDQSLGNLTVGADGLVTNVDTAGTFQGRFWDATDGTWGAWNTYTAEVDDTTGPVVTSVTVPANDTYTASENLDFTVNWDEGTYATGTPRIALDIGGTTRYANYVSGTGTSALLFRYTVQAGDNDANGIAVLQLELNGGTLRDFFDNDATLTLNSVGSTAAVLVDTVGPATTSVAVPAAGSYTTSQNLDFTVNWNENVTVTGTPQIAVTIGANVRQAAYVSGTGTSALLFRYTIVGGDNDEDGIVVGTLALNGGTLQDAQGHNANLTLNGVGSTSAVYVNVVSATTTSVDVPANGTYGSGATLSFTVNWSEVVTVTGTPRIDLTIGASTVYANYVSGSGTTATVFQYTVQGGDADTDGIAVNALELNGGTINDAQSDPATLTLNNVGSTTNVLVDTIGPVTTSVDVPLDATYSVGQVLSFTVNWDEAATVSGSPQLQLDIGGVTKSAVYASGSGTTALLFQYTVVSGDNDSDGIGITAISLNGGTIRDSGGNDATLTLNSVGDTSGVLINAVGPTVMDVLVPAAGTYLFGQDLDFSVVFDEVATVTGTPRLSIDIGGITRYADYTSGTGTTTLLFRYTVASGDTDTDGILVNNLELNGGTIKDDLGNDGVLTLVSVGDTSGVLVDSASPEVTSVGVPAAGVYETSESLLFTVNWDDTVTVTGTPRIELDIGGVTRYATYISGSGTSATVFSYTVQGADLDDNGIQIIDLELNGGSIEASGNLAILTLVNVGSTSNVYVNFTPSTGGGPIVTVDAAVTRTQLTSSVSAARGVRNLVIGPVEAQGYTLMTQARRVRVEDINVSLGILKLFRLPKHSTPINAWVIVTEGFNSTQANAFKLVIDMVPLVSGLDLTLQGWVKPNTITASEDLTGKKDRTVDIGTSTFAADGTAGEALVYLQYIMKE